MRMSSPTSPALPPSLSAKLATLAARPAPSETSHALDEILAELADLPAHSIVRASREIATSAQLGWWQQEKRPLRVIPTHGAALPWRIGVPLQRLRYQLGLEWSAAPVLSDKELLAANSDLAWLFLFHPNGYLREAALWRVDAPQNRHSSLPPWRGD